MPPKKRAARCPPSASPKKAPPAGVHKASHRAGAEAAASSSGEAMSLLRLRSSLAPVSVSTPAASSATAGVTRAIVKPGLLLRSRAPTPKPAQTAATAAASTTTAPNEEEADSTSYRPPVVAPAPIDEEAQTAVQPAANSSFPSPSPFLPQPQTSSFTPATAAARAFTVSTPRPDAHRESLDRLRALSHSVSGASTAAAAPFPGPSRSAVKGPAKSSLSALTTESMNALRLLRRATPPTPTADPPVPAAAREPLRKVRVVRGNERPPDAAVAPPTPATNAPYPIPAPRSSSSAATGPSQLASKRRRDGAEDTPADEAMNLSPAARGARHEDTHAPGTQTAMSIPAPRSKQLQEQRQALSPSLAALRAASVARGPAQTSPQFHPSPSRGGRASSSTSPLFQMAEVIQSHHGSDVSPSHEGGETSPLSRASLHSESLSTPLRAQLHDTRSFFDRHHGDAAAPAAQPFRVVSAAAVAAAPRPVEPLMRGLVAVPPPSPVDMMRTSPRRGGTGPATPPGCRRGVAPPSAGLNIVPPQNAASDAFSRSSLRGSSGSVGLAVKPRCVVFDTSSLLESQPGPLNLLMEKWIVCVPFTVLDELDKIHKSDPGKAGSSGARTDREWRKRRAHELRNWITGALKQRNDHIRLQKRMEVVEEYDRKAASNDDSILGFAVFLKRRNESVLFVSEDKFLRIKATSELGNAYAYADLLKMLGIRK